MNFFFLELFEIIILSNHFFIIVIAYRIHVSETSAKILQEIGGYHLESRGLINLAVNFNKKNYKLLELLTY